MLQAWFLTTTKKRKGLLPLFNYGLRHSQTENNQLLAVLVTWYAGEILEPETDMIQLV